MLKFKKLIILMLSIILIFATYKIFKTQPLRRAYIFNKYINIKSDKKVQFNISNNIKFENTVEKRRLDTHDLLKNLNETDVLKKHYSEYSDEIITLNIKDKGILESKIYKDKKIADESDSFYKNFFIYNKTPIKDLITGKKYNMIDVSVISISSSLYDEQLENDANKKYIYSGVIFQSEIERVFYSLSDNKIVELKLKDYSSKDKDYLYTKDMQIIFKGLNENNNLVCREEYSNTFSRDERIETSQHSDISKEFKIISKENEFLNNRGSYFIVNLESEKSDIYKEIDADFVFTIEN